MLAVMFWVLLAAPGCAPPATAVRQNVTFAVLSNVLATADRESGPDYALGESGVSRLRRTIAEINASRDIKFVILLGNLLGSGQSLTLDAVKAELEELKKPYYVVLGPEGLTAEVAAGSGDGPAAKAEPAEAALGGGTTAAAASDDGAMAAAAASGEGANAAAAADGGEAATPVPASGPADRGGMRISRSFLVWNFSNHGFSGPEGYWQVQAAPGLTLVALNTAVGGVDRPGHVDSRQLEWLDRTLAASAGETVIVLTYQALVSLDPLDTTFVWESRLVDNRAEVLTTINRHRHVAMVLSGSHLFATHQVIGPTVHAAVPALSVWPLAYDVFKIDARHIEHQYVTVGTDAETRAAFERLAREQGLVQLWGGGEKGEQKVLEVFSGRKSATWNLEAVRR